MTDVLVTDDERRALLAVLLVAIWAFTAPGGYFWPIWPILGTAPCLIGHVATARVLPGR